MLSRISIRRPVTAIMMTLIVFLTGAIAYTGLNLSLMPNVDLPIVLVSTTYVGAGPEEIENLVSKPLEESLGTVSNVDTITSISSSNSSFLLVQFVDGTDIDLASVDLREVLDLTKSRLPDDAREPVIIKIDLNAIPIYLGVQADNLDLNELTLLLEENVMNRLERIEGVASVSLSGGLEKEIRVTVDADKLAGYGLTTTRLAQYLAAENMNLPSGSLSQGSSSIQIRTIGEFTSIDEIRNLSIMTGTGALIRLSDVATVEEVEVDLNSFTYIDGNKGILILIDKQSTANLVDVSRKVQAEMDSIQLANPDLNLVVLSDTADYIEVSISNITETAFLSALIAFFVLLVFLKNPTTSLIVAVSIPTSILATFALMYLSNMTLNLISMGGLAIGIGMLVDNSIVVLDSIYQYYEDGHPPKEAAEAGAKEVSMAIFASTMTTVAVFLPIAFVQGAVGQMLQNLAFTVVFSLLSSFVVAVTFVPMACSLLLQRDRLKKPMTNPILTGVLSFWDKILDNINDAYGKFLKWALSHRQFTVALVVVIFISSLGVIPLAGVDFMAPMDQGMAEISIELPSGTNLKTTEEVVIEALYRMEDISEIETLYANVGSGMLSSSASSATISIILTPRAERERSTNEVCDEIQYLLGDIPGIDLTVLTSDSAMGSLSGSDVSFNIYGYNNDVLMGIETNVISILKKVPGLKDIEGSTSETVPEASVIIDRTKASQYGITTATIAGALNTAISGTTATQYKVNNTELDVVIRYDKDQVNYLTDLHNLMVPSAYGSLIPLSDVAKIQINESATSIYRENQKNYISISLNTDGISTSEAQVLIDETLADYNFPDGYYYAASGTLEMMNDAFNSLYLCMVVAVLLVYMIMASQFESFRYPFIIMFSMPLAITGGIFGLFITGHTITVPAFLGFVMLVGMVVNNGIVLVDYANQLMDTGLKAYDALCLAGPRRLRPILMTTLTTIFGLIPMAISTAEGSEMMQSLAIGVIFGLLFSTVITLVLIPVLYYWMDNGKQRRMSKKEIRRQKKLAAIAAATHEQ